MRKEVIVILVLFLLVIACSPLQPAEVAREPVSESVPESQIQEVEETAITQAPLNESPSAMEVPPPPPEEILSPEEQMWCRRIDAAMQPTPCLDIPKPVYPSSYYQGPLTDTHLHIPDIPDWASDEEPAAGHS